MGISKESFKENKVQRIITGQHLLHPRAFFPGTKQSVLHWAYTSGKGSYKNILAKEIILLFTTNCQAMFLFLQFVFLWVYIKFARAALHDLA